MWRDLSVRADTCGATCHVGTGRMRCDLSCWNRTDVVRPIMLEPDVAWMNRTDFFCLVLGCSGGGAAAPPEPDVAHATSGFRVLPPGVKPDRLESVWFQPPVRSARTGRCACNVWFWGGECAPSRHLVLEGCVCTPPEPAGFCILHHTSSDGVRVTRSFHV